MFSSTQTTCVLLIIIAGYGRTVALELSSDYIQENYRGKSTINLDKNGITKIQDDAFVLTRPKILILSNNDLTAINISAWEELEYMDLSNNPILEISNELLNAFPRLQKLFVNHIHINNVYWDIVTGNLKNIEMTGNGNEILQIFIKSTSLETIDIANNVIRTMRLETPSIRRINIKNATTPIVQFEFRNENQNNENQMVLINYWNSDDESMEYTCAKFKELNNVPLCNSKDLCRELPTLEKFNFGDCYSPFICPNPITNGILDDEVIQGFKISKRQALSFMCEPCGINSITQDAFRSLRRELETLTIRNNPITTFNGTAAENLKFMNFGDNNISIFNANSLKVNSPRLVQLLLHGNNLTEFILTEPLAQVDTIKLDNNIYMKNVRIVNGHLKHLELRGVNLENIELDTPKLENLQLQQAKVKTFWLIENEELDMDGKIVLDCTENNHETPYYSWAHFMNTPTACGIENKHYAKASDYRTVLHAADTTNACTKCSPYNFIMIVLLSLLSSLIIYYNYDWQI